MSGLRVSSLPQEIQDMILDKMVEDYESLRRCNDGNAFKDFLQLAQESDEQLQRRLAESIIRTLRLPVLLPLLRSQREFIAEAEQAKAEGNDELASQADSYAVLHQKFYRRLLECYQHRFEKQQLDWAGPVVEAEYQETLKEGRVWQDARENSPYGYIVMLHDVTEQLFTTIEELAGLEAESSDDDDDEEAEEKRLAFWESPLHQELRVSLCQALWLPRSLMHSSPDTKTDLAILVKGTGFDSEVGLMAAWDRSMGEAYKLKG